MCQIRQRREAALSARSGAGGALEADWAEASGWRLWSTWARTQWQMCTRMADNLQTLAISAGYNGQFSILFNRKTHIAQHAVHPTGKCSFSKPCTNRFGDFDDLNGPIKSTLTSIRKRNYWHKNPW